MATFQYVARRPDGLEVRGVITADGPEEVVRTLDERRLLPVRIQPRRAGLWGPGGRPRPGKVPSQAMAVFYGQLADLLRAGVPVLRALDVLERQSSHARLKAVLGALRHDVSEGTGLADAMLKHPEVFDELDTNMVRAGEKGAFLEDVLKRIAAFRDHQQEIRSQVTGAMIYPVVLLVLGTTLVTVLVTFLVPKFKPLFARLPALPAPTVFLLALSEFLRDHGVWVLAAAGLLVAGLWPALATPRGRRLLDAVRLRLPVLGPIQKSLAICRFCRILGTLLHNGIPILTSLRIAKDSTGNVRLAEAIDQATDNVKAGDRLADPLAASGHFPPDLIEMVAIGEESNNLEQVLVDIADSLERRTTRRIDLVVRMLEPLMLVVMAAMVLFIVAALLLPVFRMSSVIGR